MKFGKYSQTPAKNKFGIAIVPNLGLIYVSSENNQ